MLRTYANFFIDNGWSSVRTGCDEAAYDWLIAARSYGDHTVTGQVMVFAPDTTQHIFDGATGVAVSTSIGTAYDTSSGSPISDKAPDLECLEELESAQ